MPKVDMNGKRNPWEGVNLLPFIDARRMRRALADFCGPEKLSQAENERNKFGDPIGEGRGAVGDPIGEGRGAVRGEGTVRG